MTNPYGDSAILPNPFVSDVGHDNREAAPARISDELAFRGRKLSDIISENDASVRLTNCIAFAAAHGVLPFTTIGEYLDAGAEASTILCKKFPTSGAKSARELAALVDEEQTRPPRPKSSKAADTVARIHRKEAHRTHRAIRKSSIGAFVADEELSVRLSNVLAHSELRDRPVSDIFDGPSFTTLSLMRYRNLGRKSG